MGTAMAMWGKSLHIDEVVHTGKVEVVYLDTQGYLDEKFYREDFDQLAWGVPNDCISYDLCNTGEPMLYERDKAIGFAVMQMDRMDEIGISFSIKNSGTIPVKIDEELEIRQVTGGSEAVNLKSFTMDKWEIEPEEVVYGSIVLSGNVNIFPDPCYLTIPIHVIQWNGSFIDSLPWWKDTLYIRATLNG
jgi:hypothetical protein